MTMHTGYQDTKDKVTETLDWRIQMQRYPLAAIAGALAVGFVAGQMLGRSMSGGSSFSSGRSLTGSSSFGAGTSLAPSSGGSTAVGSRPHKEPRHLISPAVKSKVVGRLEDVVSDMAENLLNEVSRVGREVIVPTIVSNLTGAFTHERTSGSSSSSGFTSRGYSPKSTTESSSVGSSGMSSGSTAAGGPISGGMGEGQSHGSRFQGRGI